MSSDVLYTTRWNDWTRRPIGGHRYLTEPEARQLYNGDSEGLEFVDAAVRDDEGLPHARWLLGISDAGVRAQFFTPAGSIWRSTDYDLIEGRLWRWITRDYTYPDDTRRYDQDESTMMIESAFRPDGTGTVDLDDPAKPDVDRAHLEDAPVSGFWMDRPAFGHWDQLADPEYGIPPDAS